MMGSVFTINKIARNGKKNVICGGTNTINLRKVYLQAVKNIDSLIRNAQAGKRNSSGLYNKLIK